MNGLSSMLKTSSFEIKTRISSLSDIKRHKRLKAEINNK